MLPLLIGGTLATMYYVPKAFDSYRYWRDYQKNTGYTARYPFLTYSGGIGATYSAFNNLKRF